MYAFSPIVGWLTDRIGRLRVIAAGAVVLAIGAELAGHAPPEQANTVFIGLFLIGLGWSCALIAGSTLLTDLFPASQRVGVQGVADLAMTGAGAGAGLAAGGIVALAGFHELTMIGVVVSACLAVAAVDIINTLAAAGATLAGRHQ
jgi:MFS family permease